MRNKILSKEETLLKVDRKLATLAERYTWRQWSYKLNDETGEVIFEVETRDSYEENHYEDYIKFAAYVYGL